MTDEVLEPRGEVLWPATDRWRETRLGWFAAEVARAGTPVDDFGDLWRWSIADVDRFWRMIRSHFEVGWGDPHAPAVVGGPMPDLTWFPGVSWSYPELALERMGEATLVSLSQSRGRRELTAAELREQVRRCRAGLVRLGVGKGDRVAGYLPNIAEAVIAFLATASLGAVWTSCPPEFGQRGVIDRFAQLSPTVLIAVDGYRFGPKTIDRREQLAAIVGELTGLEAVVLLPYSGLEPCARADGPDRVWLAWDELLADSPEALAFARVPFDHPLYVLYSSGTTGRPKAIVHGHGGIVVEHLKVLALHHDLGPGDRFFWFTTTGWMMWNYLVSGLLVGAGLVLFDGDPTAGDGDELWRIAADEQVSLLGLSAPFLHACVNRGAEPAARFDLSRLRGLGSTGAPLSADAYRWVHRQFGDAVGLSSISGGTDVCSAFLGSTPGVAVRAGEIPSRFLGVDACALDAEGDEVVGEVGELVIRRPLPSMPVAFWGDEDRSRLVEAYYAAHPGMWTHGDWIVFHDDGASRITGRSDATLNRGGVRLGTAEIYAVVERIAGVADSMVVHVETASSRATTGTGRLMLFVVTTSGELSAELETTIRSDLRRLLSPRHVPDDVVTVPAIPRTMSGKKTEVPVKRILQGADPAAIVSRDALQNPEAIDAFVAMAARLRGDRPGSA